MDPRLAPVDRRAAHLEVGAVSSVDDLRAEAFEAGWKARGEDRAVERAERAEAERDALRATVERVRALADEWVLNESALKARKPTPNAKRVSVNALDGREANTWSVAAYKIRAALDQPETTPSEGER